MPRAKTKPKPSPAESLRTDPMFFDDAIRQSTREAAKRFAAFSKSPKPRPRRRTKAS